MKKQAYNPYLPSYEYVPDGEPHVFGERVYLFGSHDRFNGKDFCLNDYVCWSAPVDDLADWKYEGIIYRKIQDTRLPDPERRRLFAPDVQQGPDGRFYLYYAFDFTGTIGVAVCDTPAGAYEYYGYVRYADGTALGEKEEDFFHYDPGVLADPTGKVYLYTGFCPTENIRKRFHLPRPTAPGAMVTELEADMLTVKRNPVVIVPEAERAAGTDFFGHAFFEAPSMRIVDGTYYFIYSSENGHELCYAVSERPDGGFSYGGTLISNGDLFYQGRKTPLNYTGTNHGSIEKIGGAWYVFYHRQTNGNPYSRQGCAERIQILEDGRIPQVEMTSCGLNMGPLKGKGRYSAGIACCLMSGEGAAAYVAKKQISEAHPYFTQEGEDRESDPGQYIANLLSGAMAGFKYFAVQGLKRIVVCVRGNGEGNVRILDGEHGKCVGSIAVKPSEEWKDFEGNVEILDGVVQLWFCYEGSGSVDFQEFELL
ncbi:MAG: family 43 glycosylhydrolase [Eubacteriales bacterium]|nr:family 43 glycosylhydrolase [Eubacteriales bacterium]